MSQKLVLDAKKNARPRTYRRLVPQSPKSRPAAWSQPTLRGRSLESNARAAGLARPLDAGSIGRSVSPRLSGRRQGSRPGRQESIKTSPVHREAVADALLGEQVFRAGRVFLQLLPELVH